MLVKQVCLNCKHHRSYPGIDWGLCVLQVNSLNDNLILNGNPKRHSCTFWEQKDLETFVIIATGKEELPEPSDFERREKGYLIHEDV